MVNITHGAVSQIVDGTGRIAQGTDIVVNLPDGTQHAYATGDISWILTCTALVWLMVPGIGYLYSGLVRRKNALSLFLLAMLSMAVITFGWFFWGYSLAFSPTGGPFIGDLHFFVLHNVLEQPVPQANNRIPELVFMIFQSMFAALVPAVLIGAAAERGRVLPAVIFMALWSTVVYCPIVHWVWAPEGWAFKLGVLDFAGGGPIEICSGVTGLVYSMFLGRRKGFGTTALAFKPSSIMHVCLGTVFLWFGWLGFNGGSAFSANLRATMAIVNTNMAASMGGLAWMVLDFRYEKKWSAVAFCTGAIAGLVAITPAAGFVNVPASIFIGIAASVMSNVMTAFKGVLRLDDAMDIYACHGVSGIVGIVFTGVFADKKIAALDGFTAIKGGWINRHFAQVGYQFAWIGATAGWTAVVSLILLFLIDKIPYCNFRCSEKSEIIGLDEGQCGEWAYDYVYHRRDADSAYMDEKSFQTTVSTASRPVETASVSQQVVQQDAASVQQPNLPTQTNDQSTDRERVSQDGNLAGFTGNEVPPV